MAEGVTTDELLADTQAAQSRASDPGVSAWVSANAGAGKTHVLKLRVLRLLLAGTAPERILCLTYTKAAAAEMSQRVFADLAKWATVDEAKLTATLAELLDRVPTADDLKFARQLFARAIETPGGLKVQTIHAFCTSLLQRFPIEAQLSPGFATLDEQPAAELRQEAINEVLGEATKLPGSELGKALQTVVARAADERFDTLLGEALGRQQWVDDMARLHETRGGAPFEAVTDYYRKLFGVREAVDGDMLQTEMGAVLTNDQISRACGALGEGGQRDKELADRLARAAAAGDLAVRIDALTEAFLTKSGGPRKQLAGKAVTTAASDVADRLIEARDAFHALKMEETALDTVAATVALLRLAARVLEYYRAAKARRAALDFEDLIVHTARLLSSGGHADWVLYKLDGGLDHILVDEAQDTSPTQWSIIEALAAEFYSGEGASDVLRTVFAVGDEKQSIYSFQGAAPERFGRAGERFAGLAGTVGQDWAKVPLRLSFRTVQPLLEAVDRVFSDARRTPGVNVSGDAIRHTALRIGEAGLFEIWPTVVPQDGEAAPAFSPLDDQAPGAPSRLLAEQIADKIAGWLAGSEMLESQGRPVRASDILILVRRRQPFAPEMVRALKARKIPVAGADRIVLTEQIVVQDLMALGDFLVLPEDDLALASVLKSPLFNLDDDDLMTFAPGRRGTLWSALLQAAEQDERLKPAAETLKRWRGRADFLPPFEFFASLLDGEGCRAQLIGRLGPDAADPLDEFMNLALTYDDKAPASLQGFLSWLREGRRQIKRDMDHGRGDVRVMTVHGAKGLEAPIVILPDTCSAPGSGPPQPLVDLAGAEAPGEQETPQAWPVKGARELTPVKDGLAVARTREQEEHNRLLYVALTRARDRIYIAGFEGKNGRQKGCWYDTIREGLEDVLQEIELGDGQTGWRIATEQKEAVAGPAADAAVQPMARKLPDWALRKAPSEPQLTIPLAPSRLAPLETDDEGEPAAIEQARAAALPGEPPPPSPATATVHNRFLRGNLTHALLQHLPDYAPADRREVAERFVGLRGAELRPAVRDGIVREVMQILEDAAFAPVFGPQSRAEVPIVAEIPSPADDGPPLRLNGQIDRLARTADGILIVDYKTNRSPPQSVGDVATVYLLQLAAYRLALKQIFPGEAVRAALIWSDGALLMPVPGEILDDHQQRLWSLKGENLDAA
jgi:ATP-dependent helicase/nuclease subunit A